MHISVFFGDSGIDNIFVKNLNESELEYFFEYKKNRFNDQN